MGGDRETLDEIIRALGKEESGEDSERREGSASRAPYEIFIKFRNLRPRLSRAF